MEGESLTERLRSEGFLDADQVRLAALEQGRFASFEEALVRLGFLDESALMRAVCRVTHTPAIDLTAKSIESDVLALVSPELVHKYRSLPLFVSSTHARVPGHGSARHMLFVGMENPMAAAPVAEIGATTGLEVRPVVVGPIQLSLAIDRFYPPSTLDSAAVDSRRLVANDTSPLVSEPSEPVLTEPAHTQDATPEEADPDEDDGRRRDVPTRVILQALTKLLVAEGIIDRLELMTEVAAILEAEEAEASESAESAF